MNDSTLITEHRTTSRRASAARKPKERTTAATLRAVAHAEPLALDQYREDLMTSPHNRVTITSLRGARLG